MKNHKLIIASGIGCCLLATVAISADNGRPAPIKIQTAPVNGGTVAELQVQINQLKSQIADQQKTIDGMKIQVQKIAVGGFANKGDLTALSNKFDAMAPAVQTLQMADRDFSKADTELSTRLDALRKSYATHAHFYREFGQNGDKQVMNILNTSESNEFCKRSNDKTNPWVCTLP